MSYQVLARKWRPKSFNQMVGQEHILRMLMNALDTQRLHHAYLFTGTRGVGKTSLARLLAKCLNCETGITSQPCNTCATCLAIDSGRFLDLLEIDAASRTKVEDTRELLDNVQYAPNQGRFKIYLIDEVHMLSGHSFNALLKTLEEPPAHVKFLLATTDPKRLPITILSRCLQFNLKRVPAEQIAQQLQFIADAEQVQYEIPALEQLAHAADGSMRDALSLLDQALAYCHNNITLKEIQSMLGNIEQEQIFHLLSALAEHDGNKLLSQINLLAEQAPDFAQILNQLLITLHQIALTQILACEASPTISQLATQLRPEDVQLYYQIALIGRRDLALAPSTKLGFEMVLLRMLAFKPISLESINTPAQSHSISGAETATTISRPKAAPLAKPPASTTTPDNSISEWTSLINQLGLTGMSYALASNCALVSMQDNHIELALSTKHEPMLNQKLIDRLREALSLHFNKTLTLNIKISSDELHTTAKQIEQTLKAKFDTAIDVISKDEHVQKLMDVFGATIDIASVKALYPT
jgi:DNA polymerase III subunit gamma/tau